MNDRIPSGLGAVDRVDSGAGSQSVHQVSAVPSEASTGDLLKAHSIVVTTQMARDAERYRFLRTRMIAADFDWNETGKTVLVFSLPSGVRIGADCDGNIDAAMAAATGVKAA